MFIIAVLQHGLSEDGDWGLAMGYLDKLVGLATLATLVLLAVVVSSDAYSVAAQAQASGDRALIRMLVSDSDTMRTDLPTAQLAEAAADRQVAQ